MPLAGAELRRRISSVWTKVDVVGAQAWALIGVAILALGVLYSFSLFGWMLYPLAFGIVFGVLAAPLVAILVRRNVPRILATTVVFAGLIVVVVVIIWVAVPPFIVQVSRMASRFPDFLDSIAEAVSSFQRRVAGSNEAAATAVDGFSEELRVRSIEFADGLSATFLDIVTFSFQVASAGVLGAIIAFLAVKDLPSYTRASREWLDRPSNFRLSGALRQMSRTATGFIRGQLILALTVGVASGAVLGVLGVPFYIPLGAISALGDLIPTVGPILAGVPAVVLAWSEGGFGLALTAVIALLIIQQIESYLLVPLIIGKNVDLPALTIMVSLTIAGGLFGLVGLVLAVPVVAVLRDAVRWWFMPPAQAAVEARRLAVS